MKRKFSLLINIATLVLCVCAIMVGVYSAKTASLNVSGIIGFTAHNCKAGVSARVKNDAVKVVNEVVTPDAEGTLNPTFRTLGSEVSVDEATATGSLPLGNIFFTDLTTTWNPETIVLEITITNLSDFAITIDLGEYGSTNANITVVEASSKSKDSIATKDGTSVFTFNISLKEVSNDYPDVSDISPNLSIKFNLAKKAPVSLINFTIDDAAYQAEEGMTWGEWVDSSYNTGYFFLHFDMPVKSVQKKLKGIFFNDDQKAKDDVINADYSYNLASPGSSQ